MSLFKRNKVDPAFANASKMVADYGLVLETLSKMGQSTAYPISTLPYPKERIGSAIRAVISALNDKDKLTKQAKDKLESGYVILAGFINDDEARIVRECALWMRKGADIGDDLDKLKQHSASSPEGMERLVSIQDRIYRETDALRREITALTGKER